MLNYTKEELLELGAEITTREIYQQPDVWKEAFEAYQAKCEEIAAFLQDIADRHDYIKVILTGAGTSAYVGDTLVPYFKEVYDERKWNFNSIATTDIVANPRNLVMKKMWQLSLYPLLVAVIHLKVWQPLIWLKPWLMTSIK